MTLATRPVGAPLSQLEVLTSRPRRSKLLHLAAWTVAAASLAILLGARFFATQPIPLAWVLLDMLFCVLPALEFVTRSGLRWGGRSYLVTHVFDFAAMVPSVLLLSHDIPGAVPGLWVVLFARGIRLVDRTLGDGFVVLSVTRLVQRFEEAITDRVLLRLLAGAERGVAGGRLGHAAGVALAHHRDPVLATIRSARPPLDKNRLAQFLGLEKVVQNTEQRAFDAVVDLLDSPEVDRALRDILIAALNDVRTGVAGTGQAPHQTAQPVQPGTAKNGS